MNERFSRTALLLGEAAMKRLSQARVAVFGIGGVGGYVVEALARCGVIALDSTVGRLKCDVMRERILDINPLAEVICHNVFYLPENAALYPLSGYDYVVDAVDTVSAKIEIVTRAQKAGVKVISAMGAGNKTDPTRFEVTDLYKTSVCPLARVMRRELKARGVSSLKVVYSREEAHRARGAERTVASAAFVPSVCGLLLAREVIMDLISSCRHSDITDDS